MHKKIISKYPLDLKIEVKSTCIMIIIEDTVGKEMKG